MIVSISKDHVLSLRLCSQRLAPLLVENPGSAEQVVKDLCGIQAQEAPAAALSIRPRSAGLVAAAIEHARVQERSIVRTWGPRGTLHLLATADLGWLLSLLGPVFVAGARRRRLELGLDDATCARAIHLLRNILANQGALTRAGIVEQLALHGLHLEGQARPHLLYRAAFEGVICLGPDQGTEPTYVLLEDWLARAHPGQALSESEAYVELTRRYLYAYGPATPQDQAAWSGLPISKIRPAWRHIAHELLEVEIAGSPAWLPKIRASWLDELSTSELATAPVVRLLPRFDTYWLGYQRRDLAVSPQHAKRINAGGGILHPTLLVNGRAAGIWKTRQKKNRLEIALEPFAQLTPQAHAELEIEIADIARFLAVPVTLYVHE